MSGAQTHAGQQCPSAQRHQFDIVPPSPHLIKETGSFKGIVNKEKD
jgi:hypothetical protein